MAEVAILFTGLSSIVLSFIVVTFFDTESLTDPSLNRDLVQMTLQIATLSIDIIMKPIQNILAIGTDIASIFTANAKLIAYFFLFILVTLLVHYYHFTVLTILSDSWTCVVIPALKNLVTPILQVLRIVYALGVPLLNAAIVMQAQILKGWRVVALKCNAAQLFDVILEFAKFCRTASHSIAGYFGAGGDGGNFISNDLILAEPIQHIFNAVALMENVAICACARFEFVFAIAFIPFKERHLVLAIDNTIQIFVRVFQSLFRLLFGKLPDIYLINFKLERSLLEYGLAFDGIIMSAMEKILLFLSDGEFVLSSVPKEGPFSVVSHTAVSAWHAATTLGVNGPLKLLSVFDTESQSTFDPGVWDLTKSHSHMHQAVNGIAIFGQWLFYVLQTLVTSETPLKILREEDIPLKLNCDWVRDVKEKRYTPLHETIGCVISNAGTASVSVPFMAFGLAVEIAIKTLFTSEQGLFRTFQRWEGPTIPREEIYTCADRREMTAFNYTIPYDDEKEDPDNPKFNSKGWIWTQDRGKCQCNMGYGVTLDEGIAPYNPWCGQPSLTFDIFAKADALIMHVSHGLFGPGFGDAIPFMKPTDNININFQTPGGGTIEKTIGLGMVFPPLTRAAIESVRVLTRITLSWTDVITGRFFNYPVNCGHGLNRLQIEKKYSFLKTSTELEWSALSEEKKTSMRWHQCGTKEYLSTKLGDQLKICEQEGNDKSVNSKKNCMCNYAHPLSPSDQCKCIARYPSKATDDANDETLDLINGLFTSEQVSQHWCNSMIVEWTFQNTANFANALDYIASLGPINPQCGADGPVAGSDYLIANTPTLSFVGDFADSEDQLEALKALTASYDADECGEGETCDVSSTFEPTTAAEQNSDETLPGCRVFGRYDFFCSAGLYVKTVKKISMNQGRQVIGNGMSVLTGNFADVNFDTLPRLCDYEKQMGALASMIAAIIPNMRTELKEAFAKFINMIFQVMYIQSQRVILVIGQMAVNILLNFETLTESSLTESFEEATVTLVDGYFWAFEYFFIATGDLLNAIADGAGDICFQIVDIITMVRDEVKAGLLDTVTLVVEILMQFAAVLSGNAGVIGPLMENLFKLWAEVSQILISQMMKILGAVFEFFGPFGKILNIFASVLCEILNAVLPPLVELGGGKFTLLECMPLGRRLNAEPFHIDITREVAESLEWNGTSVCDHFMTDAAVYSFEELRPLEKATWVDCVELKILGLETRKFLQSKRFPTDIFYNWKTKYVVAYDTVRASKLILQHYIMSENRRWGDVRLLMLEQGLDADLYINMLQLMSYHSSKLSHQFQVTNLVEASLGFFDPNFKKGANPSEAAKTWRVYSQFKSAADITASEWTRRDLSMELSKTKDAMLASTKHLHNWWQTVGTAQAHTTHTDRAFGKIKHIFTKGPKNKLKSKRHRKLKVPIRTDLKTCEERGGGGPAPVWCTNCNIMDNIVEEFIFQVTQIGEFYTNEERGFPFIMANVSDYFGELMEYNADFFDTTSGLAAEPEIVIERNAERWTFYVANDWTTFIEKGWTFVTDMSNETKKADWTNQIDKFLNATNDFVVIYDEQYIPFFGYSFFYFYDYLLFSKCELQQSIFVTTSNQAQRVANIDTAVIACLIAILILITTPYWSLLPLAWVANLAVIIVIVNYLFLYIVYGYQLSCAPLMPYTLMEDLNLWYQTRLDPGCFYKLFPTMALGASDDTCLVCPVGDKWSDANIVEFDAGISNNSTGSVLDGDLNVDLDLDVDLELDFSGLMSYQNCANYLPEDYVDGMLTLGDFMGEYSVFWPGLFWLRQIWPGLWTFLVEYSVVDLNTGIGKLAMQSYQNSPIDDMWLDCAKVMFLDNIVAAAILAILGYAVVKIMTILMQTALQLFMLFTYLYNLLSFISLAIEISVVKKAKLQQIEELKLKNKKQR